MSDRVGIYLFALSLTSVLVPKVVGSFISAKPNEHQQRVACISAPGKVLIAGGYLVLEHPNLGVSVATSSRFFTTVLPKEMQDGIPTFPSCITIVVESPQFYEQYIYTYNTISGQVSSRGSNSNEFVEKCISLTMAFVKEFKQKDGSGLGPILNSLSGTHYLSVVLQAHNDFYSQIKELKRRQLPLLSSSLAQLPSFMPCPRDASGNVSVAKTGLGSSAALTTSLVSALLQWFEVTRVGLRPDSEDRRIAHNLSQLVHAVAQGKIGSGFDVAAAVYGTQMYRRFSSQAFEPCMEPDCPSSLIYTAVMSEGQGAAIPTSASVNALLDSKMMMQRKAQTIRPGGWSQTIRPFTLPYGMDIVLGDVCGGSSSTSMARQVLRWKNDKPVLAEKVWDTLSGANTEIFECLEEMNNQYRRDPLQFNADIMWASERRADEWDGKSSESAVASLLKLRTLFQTTRRLLKKMGDSAGVGIEPEAQTLLCDATANLPGVVAAGVPGAGGVDAVFALTLSSAARAGVEQMWSKWGSSSNNNSTNAPVVCPLILHAGAGLKSGIVAHFGGSHLK